MLSVKLTSLKNNNIYIFSPIKNNLINNGLFYKIIYSNNDFILNGIYIEIPLNYKLENNKVIFDNEIIDKMYEIENYILKNILYNKTDYNNNNFIKINGYNNDNILKDNNNNVIKDNNNVLKENDNVVKDNDNIVKKNYQKLYYKIHELFINGSIKLFNQKDNKLIIKLSGVWENNKSYGISFKIINISSMNKFIHQ